MSQWLREYQLTGKVPEVEDRELAFWGGWLLAWSKPRVTIFGDPSKTIEESLIMAIRLAEFIEEQK